MKVCLVGFAVASMAFDATAKTIHQKEGQYLDMDGIVTTFSGLVRYNDDMEAEYFSMTLTNWFGKKSAFADGDVFLSWIYENQVTFLEGECKVPSGNGVNPAGYIWDDYGGDGRYLYQDTGRYNIYGDKIYECSHVLDGFSDPENAGVLIRPCDRPSDAVSNLRPVWRSIQKWTDKDGDDSFAYIGNEGFYVLPDREEGWDEDEGGIQWEPVMWATDEPKFMLDIKAEFPCYWKDDQLIYHTRSIPYTVTLVVWSDPRENIPPGEEYYKKLTFSGTATANGKSYDEYFSATYNLGERLQAGRYCAYMEIRSPLSRTAPSYCTRDFEVMPKKLSVKVKPKNADWQTGSLALHWRDADLSDDVSDEASNNAIAASGKHFNIWRANGEGYEDFANAKLVGVNQAGAYWTDEKYAENLGVWPAKYWVQILSGKEEDLTAKPSSAPPASCITGRRFAILCGYDKYEPTVVPGGTKENDGHSHTVDEVTWMHESLEKFGKTEKVYELKNEKGTVGGLTNAWRMAAEETRPGDTLFFYISTHGGAAANNNRESRLETYETAARGNAYTSDIMRKDLERFPATNGVKVVNILDACFSGAMYEDIKGTVDDANKAWICSSAKDQLSDCVKDVSQFAQTFLKWGLVDGCADLKRLANCSYSNADGGDGVVTLWEMANYSKALVVGESDTDDPKYSVVHTKHSQDVVIDESLAGQSILKNTVMASGVKSPSGTAPEEIWLREDTCITKFTYWIDYLLAPNIVEYKFFSNSHRLQIYATKNMPEIFCDFDYSQLGGATSSFRLIKAKSSANDKGVIVASLYVEGYDDCKNDENIDCWRKVYWGLAGHEKNGPLGEHYVPLVANAKYNLRCRYVNQFGYGAWSNFCVVGTDDESSGGETGGEGSKAGAVSNVASSDPSVIGVALSRAESGARDEISLTVTRADGSRHVYEGAIALNEAGDVLVGVLVCGEDELEFSLTDEGALSAASPSFSLTGTFEIQDVAYPLNSAGCRFPETRVAVDEGGTAEVRVNGGDAEKASSVKVYLTYNTAVAADIDPKAGTVDGEMPKGGLKFPLTLNWAKGEVGEKVITIPVKADKAVEDDEFFTLQLADAQGMELGEERVCTVTIHDPGYDELAAKITAGTATKSDKTAWEKLQKAKAPYVCGLADPADGGKVSGSGFCAAGKKVALKATANKGFVFIGWRSETGNGFVAKTPSLVIDRTGKPAKDSATSTTITGVDGDATYYACFISAEEDKAAIAASVGGCALEPWVSKTETHAFETNIWAGVYLEWPVAASAPSATTVKVAGLPSGLKFAAKPVTGKVGSGKAAVVVTNVPANTIYGVPTAASKADKNGNVKPSEVKVTVTTAGKSSQTYQIDTTVAALPAWAQGNFDGGVATVKEGRREKEEGRSAEGESWENIVGTVSLTVSAAGKVSGKAQGDGIAYTLTAPYYSGFAAVPGDDGPVSNFLADVTASWSYKEGSKTVKTNDVVRMTVRDNGVGGRVSVDDWFEAYTVNWKVEQWKTLGKKFDKKTQAYAILSDGTFSENEEDLTSALGAEVVGRVTLKFSANGSVAVSGEFVSSYDEKTKKYKTVKASGSATLVPVDEGNCVVFVYLTPKGLVPHARCISVPWPEE